VYGGTPGLPCIGMPGGKDGPLGTEPIPAGPGGSPGPVGTEVIDAGGVVKREVVGGGLKPLSGKFGGGGLKPAGLTFGLKPLELVLSGTPPGAMFGLLGELGTVRRPLGELFIELKLLGPPKDGCDGDIIGLPGPGMLGLPPGKELLLLGMPEPLLPNGGGVRGRAFQL